MTTHRPTSLTVVRPTPQRRYLTSRQAQEFLGYSTLHAFTCAYPKLGIPTYRLGRSLRFLEEDLEAALSRVEAVDVDTQRHRA